MKIDICHDTIKDLSVYWEGLSMLKNYLLIALRFMSKQRGFSFINVSGLTIGIACSLLILLYVQDELKYDGFHADGDRIYRTIFDGKIQGKDIQTTLTAFPLANTLMSTMPEVAMSTRIVKWSTFPVYFEGRSFTEKHLLLVDRNFFSLFTFPLIEGNPDSVLIGERKVVITRSTARRYFDYDGTSSKSPVGKNIELAQGYTARISGIAEDPPVNSHIQFTILLSLESWDVADQTDWTGTNCITYFKTETKQSNKTLEKDINQLVVQKVEEQIREQKNIEPHDFKKQGNKILYKVQSLSGIHLQSSLADEIITNGSVEYIYLFSSIAAFIIILACINFMNLTTAQSASRAKEVAVRKTIGAQNQRLVAQFLLESYFYVIIAVLLAFAVLVVSLQPFNYFTEKNLTVSTLFQFEFITGIVVFVFLTGLMAGSYPAFYLTNYSPIQVLKGNLRAQLRTYGIRNILVVFQFFISSGLIIATMTVYHQLQYIQQMDLGFEKSNVINLLHTRNLADQGAAFKKELLSYPQIVSASYSNRLPPNITWQSGFRKEGRVREFGFVVYEMDYDHLSTMGYELVDGRFFIREIPDDTMSVLLNEKAATLLGITNIDDEKIFSSYDQPDGRVRNVIGIVKDFNFQSPRQPIQPLAIILGNEPNWEMAIRIKDGTSEECIAILEKLWKKYTPSTPFEYSFVENNFSYQVESERKVGLLFLLFTILAIIIACLGLFGLATFTAEQQRKSIGIRKALGASTPQVVAMLNKNFLKLVLIANLISWPVAALILHEWLNSFAYHINFPWWIFFLAGGITVLITFFSVSFQAVKAASGNPVDSLRNE